jgi:hypothetical protein
VGGQRAPKAPMDVQLKNSGFEASKVTKSLSVDSGFEAVGIQILVRV